MRFLVTAVKWVRAAGLPRDPNEPAKPKASPQDWESLGRDLGRAVRKFRDGGKPGAGTGKNPPISGRRSLAEAARDRPAG